MGEDNRAAEGLLARYAAGDRLFATIDLNRANLASGQLSRANFARADFTRANLSGVDLSRADLRGARLVGADLTDANLTGSNLAHANFYQANLSDARLIGADLRGTNFSGANIANADFSHAQFESTVLANVDLDAALPDTLAAAGHLGPSTLGMDTLRLSRGRVPLLFLRGCGLSDWEIDAARLYDPDLPQSEASEVHLRLWEKRFSGPLQYYSCFISYSHQDDRFARCLHERLQNEGLRVWFAPEEMKGGRKLHHQIDDAIKLHDKLLLILSEASMNSEWVATEISKARKREKAEGKQVLFPISLVDFKYIREWECFDADIGKDSAREIREYFIPDFSNWNDEVAFKAATSRLLKDLRADRPLPSER